MHIAVRTFGTAIAYAKVINRRPRCRDNLVRRLDHSLKLTSYMIMRLLAIVGPPIKREPETRKLGLVDWFRQNPLTPASSRASLVGTHLMNEPLIPSANALGKRKAFEKLSPTQLNAK